MIKIYPPIGTKIYAIHNRYLQDNIDGKILVGKIATYKRVGKTIVPEVKISGMKNPIDNSTHTLYYDLGKAIRALRGK